MKKIKYLAILLFFLSSIIYGQQFEAGSGFVLGFGNTKIETGPGFSLFISYKPLESIRLRTTGQIYYSEFKGIEPYVVRDNYSLFSIEESIVYYPFSYDFEPFIGLGIGYYNIAHSTSGIGSPYQGSFAINDFEENKLGSHILAGLKFSANTSLSIQLDFKYIILNQHLTARWGDIVIEENINLNTFLMNLSLLYNFSL